MEKLLNNKTESFETLNDIIDFFIGGRMERKNPYLQAISRDIGHVSKDKSIEKSIEYFERLKTIPSERTGEILSDAVLNKYMFTLRSLFNFCSRERFKDLTGISENPFRNMRPFPVRPRRRLLSQNEEDKLLSEMIKSNSPLLHALKFSLKNPIRWGDLKELKRDNLKYYEDRPVIEMRSRKNYKKSFFILIDDEMLAYWKSLPADCEYLFPFIKKDGTFTQFSNLKWKYAFTKAKHDSGISDFLWHDIRKMAFVNYKNNGFNEQDLRGLGIIR